MKVSFSVLSFLLLLNTAQSYTGQKVCSIEIEGVKASDKIEVAKKIWKQQGYEEVLQSGMVNKRNVAHYKDELRQLIYTRNSNGTTITHNLNSVEAASAIESRFALLCSADNSQQVHKCVTDLPDMVSGKPVGRPQGAETKCRGGFIRIEAAAQKSKECDYRLSDVREWSGHNRSIETSKASITGLAEMIIYSTNVTSIPDTLPNGVPSPAPHTSR
jgi:hypothetical protein